MFKAFIIIVFVGVASYAFTDLGSDSAFLSIILPVWVLVSLVSFAIWPVLLIHKTGLDKEQGIQKIENNAPITPNDYGGFGGDDGGG